jgi:hypothetical protein
MIVTFRPTINTGADYTACYINFLRCVTAIATASAGTTTLTVNPYTASNTIDTTKNCIISIDANTDAGGWTTSASHSVPSSGNNTATTYTALASTTLYQYKADFYNASGKSIYPYKKLCFHSMENSSGGIPAWLYSTGSALSTNFKTAISNLARHHICTTFGCSTTTDWTSTTFPPQSNSTTPGINDPAYQSTSFTLNAQNRGSDGSGSAYNLPGLVPTDTTVEYHMAVTADYCIIWESKVGDTFTNGYFTTDTGGSNSTYWNVARQGSIYYMGLREAQPWENAQNNNPPWTCWQYTGAATTGGTGSPCPTNTVAAFMNTLNNNNVPTTTPTIYKTINRYDQNFFFGKTSNTSAQTGYTTASQELDAPLFLTRRMGYSGGESSPNTSANMIYMPAYDTTQGLNVPPAYPIKISRSYTGQWNQGGACRGIYKSLSMPWTTLKLYWQASTQTFTIGTDTYIPFVLNEDMWLVRYA